MLDDACQVAHQVTLVRQGSLRQPRRQFRRQRRGLARTCHHLAELAQEAALVLGGKRRLVFDGVGDPAQQVGAGNGLTQTGRQLWNGQREGARDMDEDVTLVVLI